MTDKEYTFQAILSYEAESEEHARIYLSDDLRINKDSLFECIQELPILPERIKSKIQGDDS